MCSFLWDPDRSVTTLIAHSVLFRLIISVFDKNRPKSIQKGAEVEEPWTLLVFGWDDIGGTDSVPHPVGLLSSSSEVIAASQGAETFLPTAQLSGHVLCKFQDTWVLGTTAVPGLGSLGGSDWKVCASVVSVKNDRSGLNNSKTWSKHVERNNTNTCIYIRVRQKHEMDDAMGAFSFFSYSWYQ